MCDVNMFRQKFRASIIHFLFSSMLAVALFSVIYCFWYPDRYLALGATDGLVIFLCVDLVLGPLLTFVVYMPNKIGLFRDMAIILAFQLAVFVFGVWTIYLQRPYLQVLTHEQLEIYTYDDVKNFSVSLPQNASMSYVGPNIYFMYLPDDLQQLDAIRFTSEFVDGKPFALRSDLYRQFSQGRQWGLSTILDRFSYDTQSDCYWLDVSSKHFVGKGCISGVTGEVVLLK